MDPLAAGVDTSTIAFWLGHASTKATNGYLHADMALKEKALARTAPRTQDWIASVIPSFSQGEVAGHRLVRREVRR
jgi:hypothetical protein